MSYDVQHLAIICTIGELLFAVPAGLILKHIGLSSWWALLCFIPVVALIALWIMALAKWPQDAALHQRPRKEVSRSF